MKKKTKGNERGCALLISLAIDLGLNRLRLRLYFRRCLGDEPIHLARISAQGFNGRMALINQPLVQSVDSVFRPCAVKVSRARVD